MKIVTAAISMIVAILAITTIMIPTLADNTHYEEPEDTVYSNVPLGGVRYTYYATKATIPNLTIEYNSENSANITVNGSVAKWGVNTPAIVTSNLTIAAQSGLSQPNITHTDIASVVGEGTDYPSQITRLTEIHLTVTSGVISGTVKTTSATYTIESTALSWAYVQSANGEYTAVNQTAGGVYVSSLSDLTWQYRSGTTDTRTVHGGKVTDKEGTQISTLTNADFTGVETVYNEDGVTVLKVTMPPTTHKSSSVAWAIAPASYTIEGKEPEEPEKTVEMKILDLLPLILMVSLIIGLVGYAVRRA